MDRRLQIVIEARNQARAALREVGVDLQQVAANARAASSAAGQGLVSGFRWAITSVRGMLSGLMAQLLALGGVYAGIKAGKSIIGAAADLENQKSVFTALTGSAKEAGETIAWIIDQASQTPFEIPGLTETTTQLYSVGLDVEDWFRRVGNLAMLSGRSMAEGLDMATLAVVRLKSGAVGEAMEQLRRLKISQDDFKREGIKFDGGGSLISTREDALDALKRIIDSRGDLMGAAENTAKVAFSNINDDITKIKLMIAGITDQGEVQKGGFFDTIKNATKEALNWFNANKSAVAAWSSQVGNALAGAISWIMENRRQIIGWGKDILTSFKSFLQGVAEFANGLLGADSSAKTLADSVDTIVRAVRQGTQWWKEHGQTIGSIVRYVLPVLVIFKLLGGTIGWLAPMIGGIKWSTIAGGAQTLALKAMYAGDAIKALVTRTVGLRAGLAALMGPGGAFALAAGAALYFAYTVKKTYDEIERVQKQAQKLPSNIVRQNTAATRQRLSVESDNGLANRLNTAADQIRAAQKRLAEARENSKWWKYGSAEAKRAITEEEGELNRLQKLYSAIRAEMNKRKGGFNEAATQAGPPAPKNLGTVGPDPLKDIKEKVDNAKALVEIYRSVSSNLDITGTANVQVQGLESQIQAWQTYKTTLESAIGGVKAGSKEWRDYALALMDTTQQINELRVATTAVSINDIKDRADALKQWSEYQKAFGTVRDQKSAIESESKAWEDYVSRLQSAMVTVQAGSRQWYEWYNAALGASKVVRELQNDLKDLGSVNLSNSLSFWTKWTDYVKKFGSDAQVVQGIRNKIKDQQAIIDDAGKNMASSTVGSQQWLKYRDDLMAAQDGLASLKEELNNLPMQGIDAKIGSAKSYVDMLKASGAGLGSIRAASQAIVSLDREKLALIQKQVADAEKMGQWLKVDQLRSQINTVKSEIFELQKALRGNLEDEFNKMAAAIINGPADLARTLARSGVTLWQKKFEEMRAMISVPSLSLAGAGASANQAASAAAGAQNAPSVSVNLFLDGNKMRDWIREQTVEQTDKRIEQLASY
jgi:hypothetical protein